MPAEMLKDLLAVIGGLNLVSPDPQSEDCTYMWVAPGLGPWLTEVSLAGGIGLTVNVQVPTGTKVGDKLPVIAVRRCGFPDKPLSESLIPAQFIFGGGFVFGSNEQSVPTTLLSNLGLVDD